VLVAAALLLAGCAGAAPDSGARPAGAGSAGASATVSTSPSATADATASAGGSSQGRSATGKDVTREDLAEIKRQLDAMQKALDDLKMPSDSDFDGAEDAVY